MDVFGLTPIDAALSAEGLNAAQGLIDFMIRAHIFLAVFAIGFLIALWKSIKENSGRSFITFLFVSLLVFALLIISRNEPVIKAAFEPKSDVLRTQALKKAQTNDNAMPLILSYVGQMADALSIGAISVFDKGFDLDLQFLNDPFGIQKTSFKANLALYDPIVDRSLREDLEDYIYSEYLPSLYIEGKFTLDIKGNWSQLRKGFEQLINDPQAPWSKTKLMLKGIKGSLEKVDEQIVTSLIEAKIHPQNKEQQFKWTGALLNYFPYIQGAGNFLVYVSFPFLLLAILMFCRIELFYGYLGFFIWIKSLILTSAFSFYISLLAARLQAQDANSVRWFWEYPYFSIVAVMLLYLFPILSLIGVYQMFQSLSNRRSK